MVLSMNLFNKHVNEAYKRRAGCLPWADHL